MHCCNAQGAFASGVAGAIRARYPQAYESYMHTYRSQGNKLYLGQVIEANCDPHVVLNLIGQENYGRDARKGVVYVSYEALRIALKKVNEIAHEQNISAIGCPLMGAVLAGGDWSVISQIIEEESTSFQPVVYLLDGKIPG